MDAVSVLVTMPFSDDLLEKLANVSSQINVWRHVAHTPEELPDDLSEVDVLYTSRALPDPNAAPQLAWVQLHSAGINHIMEEPLYTDSEVSITTASGIHTVNMGEYVLGLMLGFARHIPRMLEDKRHQMWPEDRWARYVPDELRGATLGIVGYGSIGREVARLAQTFGMEILAMKRDVRQLEHEGYTIEGTGDPAAEIPARIYPPAALNSFLGECDYVVLTLPLTEETRHLIDEKSLAAMKPSAILLNVSRGGVVKESALVEALQQEQIGGAALDVFETEPLPKSSPLWQLPNVLLSPHVSGYTPHYDERVTDLFAKNLDRFVTDRPLINIVDRSRDY